MAWMPLRVEEIASSAATRSPSSTTKSCLVMSSASRRDISLFNLSIGARHKRGRWNKCVLNTFSASRRAFRRASWNASGASGGDARSETHAAASRALSAADDAEVISFPSHCEDHTSSGKRPSRAASTSLTRRAASPAPNVPKVPSEPGKAVSLETVESIISDRNASICDR